ncbi:MAG: YebC/PmpR family DNA-binding transcriptional regulator [Chlamydiia bacterium]
MAGHSKWANMKHRKGRADAKRGKAFTRVTREIINAVKQGGPDPKNNPKLRSAILKAKEVNLPNENIERNIKKASHADQEAYTDFIYELYGYGGVGLLVIGMTDNKNRLASDIRIATNKRGGTVAAPGSVLFNFEHKGLIHIEGPGSDRAEDLFMVSSEAGAEDIEPEEEGVTLVVTAPEELIQVKDVLTEAGFTVREAEQQYLPKVRMACSEEQAQLNQALIDWLEELDDVDEVIHNRED